jgi:hypothetical protein
MASIVTFKDRMATEAIMLPAVVDYLRSKEGSIEVIGASAEEQRADDIDLHWTRLVDGESVRRSVEVKVDTMMNRTGNFAFETISNELRLSVGCFMRSQAYWFAYVCAETRTMWAMEMTAVRDWFITTHTEQPLLFAPFQTFTKVANGVHYSTFGRLVPVAVLEKGMAGRFTKVILP